MHDTLLLASTSASRQLLLREAQIPFMCIAQEADESACDWNQPLQKLVESIAMHKMEKVVMPHGKPGDTAFVLTADTLSEDAYGTISGKPASREQALAMLKIAREGMRTGTAFCLERKIWADDAWHTDKRIVQFVDAHYLFAVPDFWLDTYFDRSIAMNTAGAIAIEGYGSLFLQSVQGSYTAIVGLPIFEVRQGLERLGFKFF
jgi:septum formation protein